MRTPDPARTLAAELAEAVPGRRVTLLGHVHRRRELATVAFLIIRDRSGLAQVVVRSAEHPADGLPPEETVVRVTGTVAANPQAPGGVEIVDPQIESLSEPAAPPVVELWRPTLETSLPTLLDHARR